jgi:hypothetical protein
MFGGLWMTDANFKSSIYIKSDLQTSSLAVTPLLYLSNGKKLRLPDVTVEAAGTAVIRVNDALASLGISSWATLSGYVEIQYSWPWNPFCITVTSVDVGHSLIFNYGLRPSLPVNPKAIQEVPAGAATQTEEGLWWKQEANVTAFVALSNTSEQPVKAQLQASDSAARSMGEHAVTISPHGTKIVNLPEVQSTTAQAGGLRVTYYGNVNQLIVNGGLEDQASGYSAGIPFISTPVPSPKAQVQSYAELGLMTGAADPLMRFPAGTTFTPYSLLRNIGNQPATVTPSIYWMEGAAAHSARLRPISLLPYQTQSLDVPRLLASNGPQNSNGSFNLVFDVEGSVLMASGSVDQKNTYVFEVLPQIVRESAAKSLARWSIADGDDTMVTLWNPADEAQDFVLTLFFSGGHYEYPIRLGPRATLMFNISEIVHSQMPDQQGNMIPPAVQEGSAQISGRGGEAEMILLVVEAGLYNVQKATCLNTCITCQGTVAVAVLEFVLSVGGSHQLDSVATYKSGTKYDITWDSVWTSRQPPIATVGATTGLGHGVSAGTVTMDFTAADIPVAGQSCGNPPPPVAT